MSFVDPKTYLWATLCRLAELESPGVDAMHRALGGPSVVSRGTVQRIKEGQTGVGLDTLRPIAQRFGMEVWQLLVPDVQRGSAPLASAPAPLTSELLHALQAAPPNLRRQAENAARNVLDMDPLPRESGEGGTQDVHRGPLEKRAA